MKSFITRVIKFLVPVLIPLFIFVAAYCYYDPFMVLNKYSNYSKPIVTTNRDYVSTEMFLQNNPTQHYNSFIFGSSRTIAFRPATWVHYADTPCVPYLFDAARESVYGVYTKLKWLDSLHVPLRNVIIVLCNDAAFAYSDNHPGHLNIKHPATSGQSMQQFQYTMFKAYLDPKFLYNFFKYQFTHTFDEGMEGYMQQDMLYYDTITNEFSLHDLESKIANDSVEYYTTKQHIFYPRKVPQADEVTKILPKHKQMLQGIAAILQKNHCNYKVVLSPLYNQQLYNANDLVVLQNIFTKHLYNFTGANYFTANIGNYYESSHFRPLVGDSIIKIIYAH